MMLASHGMHVKSSTNVISKLAEQQTNGRNLEHRLFFKPLLVNGKTGMEIRLAPAPKTKRPPARVLPIPRPKSRLSREDTYKAPEDTAKDFLNAKMDPSLHGKKLSELSKDELKSVCFPSIWGQSSCFIGNFGDDHKRELNKLRSTIESISSAKEAWNENKIRRTLLEQKADALLAQRWSRGGYQPVRQRPVTSQENILLKMKRVREAGFKITQPELELTNKIAGFSSFEPKPQVIKLSADEKKLLEEINRRTVTVRRQEQSEHLLKIFKEFQTGSQFEDHTDHEDIDLIVKALQDLSAEEREGKFWTEYDVGLIKALEAECKRLGERESNLKKIAKNLRTQKAYEVLSGKVDERSPRNLKGLSFSEKVRKNTAYYQRSHPHEVIDLLTEPETREVKRLAKQYYWMKEQLWTPTASELINRARTELENSQGLSVVEMPIQTMRKIHGKRGTDGSPEFIGTNMIESTGNEEGLDTMLLATKVQILGLALRKIPVTTDTERAFERLSLQESLMRACQERVEDQRLALKLEQNIRLDELDETEWGKLQYLFPHELEQLARVISSHEDHLIKTSPLHRPNLFPQIIRLVQNASDRFNLSKKMPFKNHPGDFLLNEAQAERRNLKSFDAAGQDVIYKTHNPQARARNR
ncbi:hypothetical protein PTTG_28419 [Puccinia triticina 1-1 BBBD Race 1]|uniref:Uncharacterized protein n=1 Tax=Puccinia triticina (isolate 1-1 / race 1 (BBBD)) TaxID=630390 RepID=A0A180GCW5_PUCT1|nr:hypothetical protein PTTG_28419 [Puccinia triticina 1-1 BBBD Race 1]